MACISNTRNCYAEETDHDCDQCFIEVHFSLLKPYIHNSDLLNL